MTRGDRILGRVIDPHWLASGRRHAIRASVSSRAGRAEVKSGNAFRHPSSALRKRAARVGGWRKGNAGGPLQKFQSGAEAPAGSGGRSQWDFVSE